jgi:hypothetical protein
MHILTCPQEGAQVAPATAGPIQQWLAPFVHANGVTGLRAKRHSKGLVRAWIAARQRGGGR